MRLEIKATGAAVLFRLSGTRDLDNIIEDRPEWNFAHGVQLQELLHSGNQRFVLDVRRAAIDTILIEALCTMSKHIGDAGGELQVVADEEQRWQFTAGLHEVVETCRSQEEALARFKSGA